MGVDNPSILSAFLGVVMDKIMALATECREIFVATKPLTNPASLVVEIGCFLSLATLALWVKGHVRLLLLCVLIVFTLAFWGCAPQPA